MDHTTQQNPIQQNPIQQIQQNPLNITERFIDKSQEEIKEIPILTQNNVSAQNENVAMKYGEKIFLRMSS
jgi:hypothetical protein